MTSQPPDSNLSSLNRRKFLLAGLSTFTPGLLHAGAQDEAKKDFPPVRAITRGPGHHWFGYYDKLQFDPTNRFVLGMKVDFEHRSPTADDVIQVGMVDLEEKDKWIPLGESRAWNWQQGCMLQWLPGSQSKVIWNDREKDRFVSHILDVKTGDKRTVPSPVYSVSPNGREAVSCDFARIADVRPGYGYTGIPDQFANDLAPEGSGVTRVNLETGETKLIVTHAQLAKTGTIPKAAPDIKHHAYHLLFSPDGARFIMLHRWRYPDDSRLTRLITARSDGTDLRIVIPNGYASHFIWRDATHILSQSKEWLGNDKWGCFLFEDKEAGIIEEIGKGVLDSGGHFTYLHHNEWIVSDTYPQGLRRLQIPHLYHIKTGRRIDLGHFPSPAAYTGEWRVDTHPRLSRDERHVCIDSPHGGQGRQLYLIDIQGWWGELSPRNDQPVSSTTLMQSHMNHHFPRLAVFAFLSLAWAGAAVFAENQPPQVTVSNIRRAYHNGEHNAFTDLCRFHGQLYLTFRSCPEGHMVHPSAYTLVMSSKDEGKTWQQVHRFSVNDRDTRDPHFLVFHDRLFVYTGTWYSGPTTIPPKDYDMNKMLGFAVWTDDGTTWSSPVMLEGTFGHYIWRAASFGDKAFLCGRRKPGFDVGPKGEGDKVQSLMLESDDGLVWKKRAYFQETAGDETAFLFETDGGVLAIGRHGGGKNAQLLRSKPPYTDWNRKDLDRSVGGPLVVKWRDRVIVGGRKTTKEAGAKTALYWLSGDALQEFAEFPSGGDCSYPGFVQLSNNRALVSYYSSHEKDESGKTITSVYLAELTMEP